MFVKSNRPAGLIHEEQMMKATTPSGAVGLSTMSRVWIPDKHK